MENDAAPSAGGHQCAPPAHNTLPTATRQATTPAAQLPLISAGQVEISAGPRGSGQNKDSRTMCEFNKGQVIISIKANLTAGSLVSFQRVNYIR